MARSLDRSIAISAPSIREAQWGLRRLADRAGDELGIRVQGRSRAVRPEPAHVVNWMAAWLLSQAPARQDEILREGRAIFDRHLQSDTPKDFGLAVVERDEPNNGDGGHAEEPARKPRRRA